MKSIVKFIILWLSHLIRRNHDSKVIYYHDVGLKYTDMGTELDTMRRHLNMVRKDGYEIVTEITARESQVMVCFDDGWAGIYDAKDFFIAEGIRPTVFIAVDLIGKPGYLSLWQILELQELGFLFEGHSWSHSDLTKFDDAGLQHEIRDSRKELSRMLGKEVEALCFPQGRFSDQVIHCGLEAGYSKLFSSIEGGYYDMLNSRRLICRNLVQSVTDREFHYILNSTSRFIVNRLWKLHYQE